MAFFESHNRTISIQETSKAVESVEVKVVLKNGETGTVNITDLMLQSGSISTNWAYHPSEIRWSYDG